jgi:acetoin utilization protein AcuB
MDLRELEHLPTIATAMTPFPSWVDEDELLTDAERLMEEHDIRHLPVKRGEDLLGVVTLRDLALALAATPDGEARIRDACISEAYVVDLHEPLDRVAQRMAELHVGSALVVRDGKLCGMFTAVDACRLLGEILAAYFHHPPADQPA